MTTAEQFTDADVRQLALVIHEARCGWNCPGHGIMQQRQDERDEAIARSVLVDLVKYGRLVTERQLRQAATAGAHWALMRAATAIEEAPTMLPSSLLVANDLRKHAEELIHGERLVPREVAIGEAEPTTDLPAEGE